MSTPIPATRTALPMPGAIGFEGDDRELYLVPADASLEPYVRHLAPVVLVSINGPHRGYPVEDVIKAIVDYRRHWPRHLAEADRKVADYASDLLVTMASLGTYAQAGMRSEGAPASTRASLRPTVTIVDLT